MLKVPEHYVLMKRPLALLEDTSNCGGYMRIFGLMFDEGLNITERNGNISSTCKHAKRQPNSKTLPKQQGVFVTQNLLLHVETHCNDMNAALRDHNSTADITAQQGFILQNCVQMVSTNT